MVHINLMRKIDFWVGVPLCFILTVLYKMTRVIGLRSPKGVPKNILFIELGEMGSSIVSYPALREIKKRFPGANVYFLIFKEIKDSVHLLHTLPADHVLTIRSKSILGLVIDTIKFPFIARRCGIDTVVDLEFFSRYSAILTYLSGAKRSSGFHRFNIEGMYRGNLYTHKVQFNPYVHTAAMYLSLVLALTAAPNQVPMLKRPMDDFDLRLPKRALSAERKKNIFEKLRVHNEDINEKSKLVLLNPNSSFLITLRRWPLDNYAMLAKKILQDKNAYVVVTGIKSEKSNAVYIKNYVQSDRCIDLAGETTLEELVDLYNVADVLVTNDSGPAQFAALTDIKIIVFFGPETPVRFKPLSENVDVLYSNFACSPCVSPFNQLNSACKDNRCLKVISVDEVYKKVISKLR